MAFVIKMILRLCAVASVCLALAVGWIVQSVGQNLPDDVAASAERVAWVIQDRARFGTDAPHSEMMLSALKTMGPGICVDLAGPLFEERHFCSGWGDIGGASPDWFRDLLFATIPVSTPVSRAIMLNGQQVALVIASAEPEVRIRKAWGQVRLAALGAIVMTLITAVVAGAVLFHALLPGRALIRAMRRLEGADYSTRLPNFDQPEFRRIAIAFNELADRLATISAERSALTRRLFQIQEEERRTLARELHDEFGQCLTSTGALAASIDSGATKDRPDLAQDARAIGDIVTRMMATLRSALERLRPPELESLGLEGSLRQLIGIWNRRNGAGVTFHADIAQDTPPLAEPAALAAYRITQECLTNAVRHGAPTRVNVSLAPSPEGAGHVVLVVEDDGEGDGRATGAPGHGILGMRERVAALGGRIDVGRIVGGFRVSALIPTGAIP